MRNTLATMSASLAFCIAAPVTLAQSTGHAGMASDHMMATPDELKWVDIPSLPPGAKLAVIEGPLNQPGPVTFRVKFPANYLLPAHWHPAIEHVTVISGTFNMGTGDQLDRAKTKALRRSKRIMMVRLSELCPTWTRRARVSVRKAKMATDTQMCFSFPDFTREVVESSWQ